jgi:hypothetical protein
MKQYLLLHARRAACCNWPNCLSNPPGQTLLLAEHCLDLDPFSDFAVQADANSQVSPRFVAADPRCSTTTNKRLLPVHACATELLQRSSELPL